MTVGRSRALTGDGAVAGRDDGGDRSDHGSMSPGPISPGSMSAWMANALGEVIGSAVAFREPMVALDWSYGPSAFGFALAGAALPEEWSGPLLVRMVSERVTAASLAREAAVLGFCSAQGYRACALRALLESNPELGGRAALVTTRPQGQALEEMIRSAPDRSVELFGRLAERHAALHTLSLPSSDVPGGVVEEIDRIGGRNESEEWEWLRVNAPPLDEPAVLCHGSFQPGVVSGHDQGELTVRNWTDSVRAAPEYDVAKTLIVLWSAPFYAETKIERASQKMVRGMVANIYRGAYEKLRPLDPAGVRYWQAYHAVRTMGQPDTPADLVAALAEQFRRLVGG